MKLCKTKISLLFTFIIVACILTLALAFAADGSVEASAEGGVSAPQIESATFDGVALTLTSNMASKELVYDNSEHPLTVTAVDVEGITFEYSWYYYQVIPIVPGAVVSPTDTPTPLPPYITESHFEGNTTYAYIGEGNTVSVKDVSDSGFYYCAVTASNGESSADTVLQIEIEISRAEANITLSQTEITYVDGLTIDLTEYITVLGGGNWTASVEKSTDVAFDYDGDAKTVSNVTKAGGDFTVTVVAEHSSDDNYLAGQKEFTITLKKGVQNVTIVPPEGVETFLVQTQYIFAVEGAKTANVSLSVYEKGEAVSCSNNGGGAFTVTDRGVDGKVTLRASASGSDLYEAGEDTFTFYAQKKPSDKPYTLPSGLSVQSGQPLSTIAFTDPSKYSWKDGRQVLYGAGERTAIALFTSDPDNYTPIEVELTVTVIHGSHAVCVDVSCNHDGHSSVEYVTLNSALYTTWETGTDNGLTYYVVPSGNYVITENMSVRLKVPEGNTVTICLAGNTITCSFFRNFGTLNICDCSTDHSGKIITTNTWGLYCYGTATVNLYSGTIECNLSPSSGNTRRAVHLTGANTIFNMYDGRVVSHNRYVHAIYSKDDAAIHIFGGEVSANNETAILSYGSVEISGGTIIAPSNVNYEVYAIQIMQGSSASSTLTISGGRVDGKVILYATTRMEIQGSDEIPIGSICMMTFGKNSANDYYLDLSRYSGPTQYTVYPYEESQVVSNAIVARGNIQNVLIDSTQSYFAGWGLIEESGEVKLTHLSHDEGTQATCMSGTVCSVCGDTYGDVNPSNHQSSTTELSPNADGKTHNKVHACCKEVIEEGITCVIASDASTLCTKDKKCECGQVLVAKKAHTYDGYKCYAAYHYQECLECDYYTENEAHSYDDENDDFCNVCNAQKAIGYNICIGEIEVTSLNKDDVLGEADDGATVTYNPQTNVLTLNNANLSLNWHIGIDAYDYVNNVDVELNLHLIGTNTISVYGYAESYGIAAGYIKISADNGATLSVTVEDGIDDEYLTTGMLAEIIYVESGKVTVSGEYMAVLAGKIIASAKGSTDFNADTLLEATISSDNDATVLVNDVVAKTAELTPTYCLTVGGVAVSANNAGNIFDDEGVPTAKYDLATNTLTLTNANITSAGTIGAIEAMSADGNVLSNLNLHLVGTNVIETNAMYGILVGSLTVTAEEGASLSISNVTYGILSYGGKIDFKSGLLTISNVTYGISAEESDVKIEGGKIKINATNGIYSYMSTLEITGGEVEINANLAIMIESDGAIVAPRHVIVGSLITEATDLTLATVACIENATSVFIGEPSQTNAAKTVRIYPHVHSWAAEYTSNTTAHWHECTAIGCYETDDTLKGGYALHSPEHDDGDCTTAENCVCGAEVIAVSSHAFDNDCDATCSKCSFTREVSHSPNDDDGNCQTAITCSVCGVVTTTAKAQHAFDNSCDTSCNNVGCLFTRVTSHVPNGDDGDCTTAILCSICNLETTSPKEHAFDNVCDTSCNNVGCSFTRVISHVPNGDDGDCTTDILCSICNAVTSVGASEHDFSGSYLSDEEGHYHKCANCNVTDLKKDHVYADDGDCTTAVRCNDCNYKVLEEKASHTWDETYLTVNADEDKHYHVCTVSGCTKKDAGQAHVPNIPSATEEQAKSCTVCSIVLEAQIGHVHSYNETVNDNYKISVATCTTKATYYKSCVCGYMSTEIFETGEYDNTNHTGTVSVAVGNNNGTHDVKYSCCGAVVNASVPCSGGTATCSHKAVCSVCLVPYGATLPHTFSVLTSDDLQHWNKCQNCDVIDEKIDHDGTATCLEKAVCSVCDKEHGEKNMGNHTSSNFVYVDNANDTHVKKNACCGTVINASEAHTYGANNACVCGAVLDITDIGQTPSTGGNETENPSLVEPENEGLSGGAIAGIAVGSTVGAGVIVFAIIWFVVMKKSFQDIIRIIKK